ncbi:MAG: SIS domain-containing protein [Christensenellaceae bacterium]
MTKYDSSIDRILDIEWIEIKKQKEKLNRDTVEQVIDLLLTVKPNGHKVITAGCGTSSTVARRVVHTLSVVEVPAFYCSPTNSIHGGMGAIQKDDVVVLFSKGGNTPEIVNYISVCKSKGAKIIAVTQNDHSMLAKNADIYFKIQNDEEADKWNMCASASCTTVIAVWDAIAFTIMEYNGYTKEDLLLTHSGGKVGEMLRENKMEERP